MLIVHSHEQLSPVNSAPDSTINRKPLFDVTNMNNKRCVSNSDASSVSPCKRPRTECLTGSLLCHEDSLQELPQMSETEDNPQGGRCLTKSFSSDSNIGASDCGSDAEFDEEEEWLVDEEIMKERDEQYKPSEDMWRIQSHIRPHMRSTLIDWIYEVAAEYEMQSETSFIALNYIDRYLSIEEVNLQRFQLLGVTALFIAAKYQEVEAPTIARFADLCNDPSVTIDAILEMEQLVTQKLEWNLSPPTSFAWLRLFLERYKTQQTRFSYHHLIYATQRIQYFYMDPRSVDYSAGTIAAAAAALVLASIPCLVVGFDERKVEECRGMLEEYDNMFEDQDLRDKLGETINNRMDEQIHNSLALERFIPKTLSNT